MAMTMYQNKEVYNNKIPIVRPNVLSHINDKATSQSNSSSHSIIWTLIT